MLSELKTEKLPLEGAFLVKPGVFQDKRGVFWKFYTEELMLKNGAKPYFPEEFLTTSRKGVLRGLHYQGGGHPQAKLIRCTMGEVYDVIVDLRKGSPTFGKWHGVTLSEKNMLTLYVPRGFAHGFVAREDGSALLYKTDAPYFYEHERGIIWNDPDLNIDWGVEKPVLSEKDSKWPSFKDAEHF